MIARFRLGLLLAAAVGALALGMVAWAGCGGAAMPENPPDNFASGQELDGDGGDGIPMVNRIAYIDNSGDLRLVNPDGTGGERLTGDFRAGVLAQALARGDSYGWPTWHREGDRLAVSRVSVVGRDAGLSVQLLDLPGGRMVAAYENEVPAPVAEGAAHYIYWSPEGRYLSFLAPTPDGLALLVRDYQSGGAAVPIAVGAPLYYHWGPRSELLAVHSGNRLLLLEPSGGGGPGRLEVDAVGFRAPALSPDGDLIAYAAREGEVHGVFVRDVGGRGRARLMAETRGMVALAWAPDGSALAVAEAAPGSPVLQRLSLFPADGSAPTVVLEEQHLAFFWSPAGDRIAWVGVDPASRRMELWVAPAPLAGESGGGGEARRLFRFSPTGEFFTWLSFFDQYAYSHSIWAPDGSALVVTGNDGPESGRRNGGGPVGGQVYVVDADTGETAPIASGKLAVWSWN